MGPMRHLPSPILPGVMPGSTAGQWPAATRLLIAGISRAQIVRERWTEKEKRLAYTRVGATRLRPLTGTGK